MDEGMVNIECSTKELLSTPLIDNVMIGLASVQRSHVYLSDCPVMHGSNLGAKMSTVSVHVLPYIRCDLSELISMTTVG